VHKYILLFLSISGYVAKMMTYLNEIKAKKCNTPSGVLSLSDVIEMHMD
jgi:hypothetical protein